MPVHEEVGAGEAEQATGLGLGEQDRVDPESIVVVEDRKHKGGHPVQEAGPTDQVGPLVAVENRADHVQAVKVKTTPCLEQEGVQPGRHPPGVTR